MKRTKMTGYLVFSVDEDVYGEKKELCDYDFAYDVCEFFSFKEVKVGENLDGYIAVKVVKVNSIKEIECSLFEHDYDGEFIEYFLQRNVPYSFR